MGQARVQVAGFFEAEFKTLTPASMLLLLCTERSIELIQSMPIDLWNEGVYNTYERPFRE